MPRSLEEVSNLEFYDQDLGVFNNELDLKCMASTYPSVRRAKHVRLTRSATSPIFIYPS